MTTTSRLIILTGFLAGSAFGYFDFFRGLTQDLRSEAAQSSSQRGGRSSGLKLVHDSPAGGLPLPNDGNTVNLLLRYADLAPRESKEELTRLLEAFTDEKKQNAGLYWTITYLAYKLGMQSPEEVKQLLIDKNSTAYQDFLSPLLEGWAEKDFQGAMAYLLTRKQESESSLETFHLLVKKLAKKDPDQAIQWISTLTPGERTTALHAMADEFPKNHPEKMAAYVALLTDTDLKSYPIQQLASTWAATDWDAAYAWANSLKGGKKQEGLAYAMAGLGKTDLPKATEEFKKTDKKYRDSIGITMMNAVFDAPDISQGKGLDWVLENQEHFSNPEHVLHSCLYGYRAQSPEVAKKVLQMPEGKLRDEALGTIIQSRSNMAYSGLDYTLTRSDSGPSFQDTLALADSISDTTAQHRAVNDCLQNWINKSPEEARQWIMEKSKLPEQDKQNLLKDCDSRQKEEKTK